MFKEALEIIEITTSQLIQLLNAADKTAISNEKNLQTSIRDLEELLTLKQLLVKRYAQQSRNLCDGICRLKEENNKFRIELGYSQQ